MPITGSQAHNDFHVVVIEQNQWRLCEDLQRTAWVAGDVVGVGREGGIWTMPR